jgi:hypothetical protein
MPTPPDFTAGAILTAAQLNQIGAYRIIPTVSGTGVTVNSDGLVTLTAAPEPYITAFSADYAHYRIYVTITAATGGASGIFMRMASGTTPNTTAANYRNVGGETAYSGSSVGVVGNNGSTAYWNVGRYNGATGFGSIIIDIMNPFASTYTSFNTSFRDYEYGGFQDGMLQVTTSYNTFNIRTNGTNTLTGTIQVYGYN